MTSIEWTNKTWNPITGCSKVSAGCAHCYAETIANRFWGDRKFTDVQFHPERLEQPLKWRKPRMVFVNSMSDLFHESVTDEQLNQIFAVMALTPQHTYQVLTKRPGRMLKYMQKLDLRKVINAAADLDLFMPNGNYSLQIPLSNIWLGVTCENQKAADERIPLLLQTPAAVRFLSCEPLLEEVDLSKFLVLENGWHRGNAELVRHMAHIYRAWVIVGGESGHGARPCNIEWIRSIVEQCRKAGVACFVKQLGSNPVMNVYNWYEWCDEEGWDRDEAKLIDWEYKWGQPPPGTLCFIPSKGKGGNPDEWPEDLRVREFPQ